MTSNRVRLSIECDEAHLPVVSQLLLVGGMYMKLRAPPAFELADYLTDEIAAETIGADDVDDLDPQDLVTFASEAMNALQEADPETLRDLDAIDVDVRPA